MKKTIKKIKQNELKAYVIEKGGRSPKITKLNKRKCMNECLCFDPQISIYNTTLEVTSCPSMITFLSQIKL